MVSNKETFRIGKVQSNPHTRIFFIILVTYVYVCICLCDLFSWLLVLSHVFVHAFIRLLDFIVLNGVNITTKSTPVFQQPEFNTKQNSLVFSCDPCPLTCMFLTFSVCLLNQTRFCLLLLMTPIIYNCLSICLLCCTSEQHALSHT